jgi:hypothetical protein
MFQPTSWLQQKIAIIPQHVVRPAKIFLKRLNSLDKKTQRPAYFYFSRLIL